MRLIKSHLVIFFALMISNCASALPSQPPEGLTIYFSRGGGMDPGNDSLTIRNGQLIYTDNYIDAKAGFTVPITEQEMAGLYNVLRDNKFDRIKVSDDRIHDKGGESISLSWAGHNYNLGTSGADVKVQWQNSWRKIVSAFEELIKIKSMDQHVFINVIFDKSLASRYVRVSFNQLKSHTLTAPADGSSHVFKLLPGSYQMHVTAIRDYDPKISMPWEEVRKRMQESHQLLKTTTKTLTISLVNEQLSVVAE